ncbi:hypothetical protein [Streptomyces sp. cmx-18-6]|uniref:hypothetical protein n=1 Tax=Streptomyces sp. cmx-18-6 TaxID=2790930 RepID=UPI00397FF941
MQHRFLARACGESRNLQVLEDTPAGGQMDSYHLADENVVDVLARDYRVKRDDLEKAVPEVWATLSERYAEAAEGPVIAFAADITEDSVLGKDELRVLLAHPEVGKEGVKFPVPMPRHEHLPPEIDEFIAEDAVRCQVRMGDFDVRNSPRDFAAKLGAIDVPEGRQAAHAQVLSRLSAASTYDEPNAPPPAEPKQQSARASAFMPGVTVRPTAAPAAPRGPTGHGVINPMAVDLAAEPAGAEI